MTGDRVVLTKQAGATAVVPEAGPGRTGVVFETQRRGGSIWVYPNDVVAKIASGRLDERLFEVTALAGRERDDSPRAATSTAPAGLEPETYEVALDIIDRNGNRVTSYDQGQLTSPLQLINLDNGERLRLQPSDGRWVAQVPRGTYTLTLHVLTPTRGGPPSGTLYSAPEIVASGPVALTVDARRAKRATALVDNARARTTEIRTTVVQLAGEYLYNSLTLSDPETEPKAYVLPTAKTDRVYGFMLQQLLEAPDRTYDLLFAERDALPAHPTYRVSDSDLADVTTIFGAQGVPASGQYQRSTYLSFIDTMVFSIRNVSLPSVRRELVTTSALGEPIVWAGHFSAYNPAGDWIYEELPGSAQYEPGQAVTTKLSTAAFTPQATGAHVSQEGGSFLWVGFEPWSSSGGHRLEFLDYPQQGEVVLERNGVEVARSSDSSSLYYVETDQAAGIATYTVTMQASRDVPWSRYTPRVSGTWRFTSTAPPDGSQTKLPVITTRISGPFDGWGRAPAGRMFPLKLDIAGARDGVAAVRVRVSYDDGRGWATVPVGRTNGEWTAWVRHPRSTAEPWVSLRVDVTDHAGDSAAWTAYRSYQIADLG